MRILQKLRNLNGYLRDLRLPWMQDVTFSYVTSQADATTRLDKASGFQVLVARPDCTINNVDDGFRKSFDTAVFVLEKDLGNGKTDKAEALQYDRAEGILDEILGKLFGDLDSDTCNALAGLSLVSVVISPEIFIFGGWNGYSAQLTFEG